MNGGNEDMSKDAILFMIFSIIGLIAVIWAYYSQKHPKEVEK